MKMQKLHALVQDFRAITESKAPEGRPDGQLLHDFASRQDETAFAVLVRRHGPMVLGVCRRILRQVEDAEDAFQATFLVLIKKAQALGRREILGNWLHGVACHTALKARAAATARQAREKAVAKCESTWEDADREALAILDKELSLLPARYRAVIVLCDLEGKTQKQAALQLGCPEGTLASQLVRGRTMLAKRVARRGVTLAGTGLPAPLPQFAPAPLPSALVAATMKTATTAVPTVVLTLANTVVRGLLLTKLKTVGFCALGLCLAGVAVGFAYLTFAGSSAIGDPMVPPAKQLREASLDSVPPKNLPVEQAKNTLGESKLFSDPLPRGAVARLGTLAFRHGPTSPGENLAFTGDGKGLVSVGGGFLRRWDLNTGQAIFSLGEGYRSGFHDADLAITDDARLGFVFRIDRVTNPKPIWQGTVYDLKTGKPQGTIPVSAALANSQKVYVSPDGKLCILSSFKGGNGQGPGGKGTTFFIVWHTTADAISYQIKPEDGYFTAWVVTRDGQTLLVGDDVHTIHVFDLATGKEQRSFGIANVRGIGAMAVSADGKYFATASPGDDIVRLWNLEKGTELRTLPLPTLGMVSSLQFAPDGRAVFASVVDAYHPGACGVRCFDFDSGNLRWEWSDGFAKALTLAVDPQSKTLATMNDDGVIRLWDAATGKEVRALEGSPTGLSDVCFQSDGKQILTWGTDNVLRSWDAASGKLVGPVFADLGLWQPQFTHRGNLLVAQKGKNTIRLYDSSTSKVLLEAMGNKGTVSADGKRLATSAEDRYIRVYDVDQQKQISSWLRNEPDPSVLGFTSDGQSLILKGDIVSVWNVATGKEKTSWSWARNKALQVIVEQKQSKGGLDFGGLGGKGNAQGAKAKDVVKKTTKPLTPTAVALSPDGTQIAFAVFKPLPDQPQKSSTWVLTLETATGKLLHQIDLNDDSTRYQPHLLFSPDGKLMAYARQNAIHVWETGAEKVTRKFEGHRANIAALAFSPDSKRLASASSDTTVLVWEVAK